MLSDDQRKDQIAALLEEKRGYELRDQSDRAKEVDAELKKLSATAATPAKRATRATRKPADAEL